MNTASTRLHLGLLATVLAVLAWSGWEPKDRFTWFLEVVPGPIAAVILFWLYPRWRLTQLVLVLVAIHAVVLMVGGKYTYAEVPLFNGLRDDFGLARNYYDRVGHFMQGFVPAMVAREVLLRNRILPRGPWLFAFVACIAATISVTHEFIEWWVALASGQAAEAFLGTQGDPWDTQWDMFLAVVGAIAAQLALARAHNRQLGLARRAEGEATLREITNANLDAVADLRVSEAQKYHVASVGKTFRQAAGRRDSWLRAIYAGEEAVGLLALVDPSLAGEPPEDIYLWRLLVDARHQGRGFGRAAIALAIAYARTRPGCRRMSLSHVPSNDAVGRLYEQFGFRHIGQVDEDGELEMVLELAPGPGKQ